MVLTVEYQEAVNAHADAARAHEGAADQLRRYTGKVESLRDELAQAEARLREATDQLEEAQRLLNGAAEALAQTPVVAGIATAPASASAHDAMILITENGA